MKKQALLIGINQYQILPELKYARQDAEAVADSLKQNYCFLENEVMLLTDAKLGLFKPTDRYIIQDHLEKLANQDLDLFIFGFWGHGLFRNGKRYLCPLNVMANRAEYQGLPFDELQELLANIHAKNTCLILDCCQTIHDRGEAETLTVSDKASMENAARDIVLRRKEQIPDFQSNVAILNSCKEGQSAYEWDARQHGLFTAHLLDAMKKRSNSVMQIASFISSNIEKTALELGKDQTPFYKLEGDIVLPVETKSSPLVTGDVFISYRHCNADLVVPIEEELKRRGISYFIDRVGINYSMDYSTVIARAIKACKVLLVMWTKEANDSPDMLQEIVTAKQFKKKVLPYKLGTFDVTEHDSLCYQLLALSRCEAITPTPESVMELVNRIQLLLDPSASIPPVSILTPQPPVSSKPKMVEDDPIAAFIEEEKRKKLEAIKELQNEALSLYQKDDVAAAISKLESVLILEPNLKSAKEILSLCQSKLAFQKVKREAEEKEATERKRKEDEERIQREAEKQRLVQIRLEKEKKNQIVSSLLGSLLEYKYKKEMELNILHQRKQAGERKTYTVNGVEFAFRWCPDGTFMMGSPTSEKGRYDDETQHRVTLTKGFWMMETEVTQKQWKAVMGNNPSRFKGDDLPVERVSWNDCQEFCKKCAQLGLIVQLPSEAQWEYACRAGSTGAYAGVLDDMAWYSKNSGDKTHSVGTKKPNAWGLYDMHGNVWEWCQDWKGDYLSGCVTDPVGPSSGSDRVSRGGSWRYYAGYCRSARRGSDAPDTNLYNLGFRVVLGQ